MWLISPNFRNEKEKKKKALFRYVCLSGYTNWNSIRTLEWWVSVIIPTGEWQESAQNQNSKNSSPESLNASCRVENSDGWRPHCWNAPCPCQKEFVYLCERSTVQNMQIFSVCQKLAMVVKFRHFPTYLCSLFHQGMCLDPSESLAVRARHSGPRTGPFWQQGCGQDLNSWNEF